jgi:hypothetical protein
LELHFDWCTCKAFITDFRTNPLGLKQSDYLREAPSRQSNVFCEIFATAITRGFAYVESRIFWAL